MRLLCCAGAAESRLTHAQNPAFKHRLLLLHTGKVQTRGRERRECRKKEKEEGEDGEERMRNWNMIAEPATFGERWTWDWGTGVTESLPTNRGNNPPLPSLHLLWYDVMWVALLILFNYLLWLFIYLFIYILFIFYLYFYLTLSVLYTTSRFGSTVPHALMDHIESYLRNHDIPAPDAEHFTQVESGCRQVSCDRLFNVDFLTGIIHTNTVLSSTHIFIRSHKWYHGRPDTTTKASCTPFTKFCWTWSEWKNSETCLVSQILVIASSLNVCFIPSCNVFFHKKIEKLGLSQVVNIIKELRTEFDEPIALLCKEANLG